MYILWISLKVSARMLLANKVRSILTLLGIIIGVAAVISIVSLGEGLRNEFEGSMDELGTDVLFMAPKAPQRPGQAPGKVRLFSMDDMEAIEDQCPSIESVDPGITAQVTVKYRNKTTQAHVQGVGHDYLQRGVNDEVETGRFFTLGEVKASARVLLIGDEITDDLFESKQRPIGADIRINGVTFTIIGKMAKRSGVFQGGPNIDTGFLAPISTVQKRLMQSDEVFWVTMNLKPDATLEEAKAEVATVMRQRRRIRNVSDDSFQFISPDDFADIANQFINVLVGVFGGIAFISLLVGGVGIMNIMLVSVTERTSEIGLRMAVGANRSTILTQFLVESIILTLSGGVIGMLLGWAGAFGLSVILEQTLETSWNPHIPPNWVAYSIGVSMLVGILFGTYPAYKASKLDPVEAIGYE